MVYSDWDYMQKIDLLPPVTSMLRHKAGQCDGSQDKHQCQAGLLSQCSPRIKGNHHVQNKNNMKHGLNLNFHKSENNADIKVAYL